MNIAVIGAGYVGSVTATGLAELGHTVFCADVDAKRIAKLAKGNSPFFEARLEPMLRTNLEGGRLTFSTDIKAVVPQADIVFLCIGTPPLPSGKPDMKPLERAIQDIASALEGHTLIVEKSTLPIKTGEWLIQSLEKSKPEGATFDLAVDPQFLREGQAVYDFMHPDRIVIGSSSQRAIDTLVQLYQPLNAPILITDMNSAELIKHASNAFLAMKISFINSIGQICERTGADIEKVAKGIGLDHRIHAAYLNAGVGYGGIFFPKDIASLVAIADQYSLNLDLLKSVDTINRYQRLSFIEKIEKALGNVEDKTIAIWGLAYRPNTDDLRDAPSLTIIRSLRNRGAKVKVYDPLAMGACKEILPQITFCQSPYEAAENVDAIVILTEWEEFEEINFKQLKESTACRLIIDGRNLYQCERMSNLGFQYLSVGRVPVVPADPSQPVAKPAKSSQAKTK